MKRQIDRFRLIEPLGEGGFGTVYRAEETLASGVARTVAFKLLPASTARDKSPDQRYVAEVRSLASLQGHPNIVCLLAAGTSDGSPWIVTEYLGRTLQESIGDSPANPEEVERVLRDVGKALSAMHGLTPPLLHNDLKPGNILQDAWGNCKVADFGTACAEGTERTRVVATVRYAAPELLSREFGTTGPWTDLYALGHIAYELALGAKHYRKQFPSVYDNEQSTSAPPGRWMAWHCSARNMPLPVQEVRQGFPAHLSNAIAQLMNKNSNQRGTAVELLQELDSPAATAVPSMTELVDAPVPAAAATQSAAPRRPAPIPAQVAPAPVAAASGQKFFVRLRGQVSGPFDLATLQRQARQGRISRLHQVSADRTNWQNASTVEGLFSGTA